MHCVHWWLEHAQKVNLWCTTSNWNHSSVSWSQWMVWQKDSTVYETLRFANASNNGSTRRRKNFHNQQTYQAFQCLSLHWIAQWYHQLHFHIFAQFLLQKIPRTCKEHGQTREFILPENLWVCQSWTFTNSFKISLHFQLERHLESSSRYLLCQC